MLDDSFVLDSEDVQLGPASLSSADGQPGQARKVIADMTSSFWGYAELRIGGRSGCFARSPGAHWRPQPMLESR